LISHCYLFKTGELPAAGVDVTIPLLKRPDLAKRVCGIAEGLLPRIYNIQGAIDVTKRALEEIRKEGKNR